MIFESNNKIWGRCYNPYNKERTAGGSSGGDAALVSSRCVLLGVGNDIGGSIRIPAAFCGIYGFKPTAGRLTWSGVTDYSSGLDG